MILGKWPTWRTNFFYVFIFIFNSLHVSSTLCSSSGETNCVNTTSGSCHSVSVAVSCAGRKWTPLCVCVGVFVSIYDLSTAENIRILDAFAKLRKATLTFFMSVCPPCVEQFGFHWTDFHETWYLTIFPKIFSRNLEVHQIQTRIQGVLSEGLCIFISHSILLRMGSVSDKSCIQNQITRFMFSNFLPKIAPFMR